MSGPGERRQTTVRWKLRATDERETGKSRTPAIGRRWLVYLRVEVESTAVDDWETIQLAH